MIPLAILTISTTCLAQTSPNSAYPPHGCDNYGLCEDNPTPSDSVLHCPSGMCFCLPGTTGPTCSTMEDLCSNITCGTSGTCQTFIGYASCVCNAGYSGASCEYELGSPCLDGPCKNGGTCEDTGAGSYACHCETSYMLPHCEYKDQCDPNPCQNGGTCTNLFNGEYPFCTCPPTHTGQVCQNKKIVRLFDPVSQGCFQYDSQLIDTTKYKMEKANDMSVTKCKQMLNDDTSDIYKYFVVMNQYCFYSTVDYLNTTNPLNDSGCDNDCPGNKYQDCGVNANKDKDKRIIAYSYDNVQVDTDSCDPSYCSGGVCVDSIALNITFSDYFCLCESPNTGSYTKTCTTPPVISNPNPCSFFTCSILDKCIPNADNSDYHCQCFRSQYYGKNCDMLKPCRNDPCQYGGTCINNDDGTYNCQCLPHYSGPTCEEINVCDYAKPCVNGDCQNLGTGIQVAYKCNCQTGWTGELCDEMVNLCNDLEPCQYNSTCTPSFMNYTCTCVPGTSGANCEINFDDCAPNPCKSKDKDAICVDGLNSYTCNCSANFVMEHCDMHIVIRDVMYAIYGKIDPTMLPMLESLMNTPAMIKDLVPFLIGQMDKTKRTSLSWTASDIFEWATYEDMKLDFDRDFIEWNDVVLGNCFSFNHRAAQQLYKVRSSGQEAGFQALMRVRQDEYVPWYETAAIIVFIHTADENIFSESVRYNAEPNNELRFFIDDTIYTRLRGKYGVCVNDPDEVKAYYSSGTYTTDGCLRACYQDMLMDKCGCMDPRYPMPDNATVCPISNRTCVDINVQEEGDPSTWESCVCPLPCFSQQYGVRWNKATFKTKTSYCDASDKSCLKNREDMALITTILPTLQYSIYAETPAMDINKFIANLGGLLGVLMGISIISAIEFIVIIFTVCKICICGK